MALRGQKPKDRKQRLKLLLSGPAGVGKTTASIQMPRPYLMDTEAGSVHYGATIEKSGGLVYEPTGIDDAIVEVRSLMTEKHDFLTLVLDPVTTLYYEACEAAEKEFGTDFGKHVVETGKKFKRLCSLLTAIDMNVVITAHSKKEYAMVEGAAGKKEMVCIGDTFDGYKKLDYVFDLWLQLSRKKGETRRDAFVAKTRIDEFPDQATFEWSYGAIVERFGKERLEKGSQTIVLATTEDIEKFQFLLSTLGEEEVKSLKIGKAMKKYPELSDMPQDAMRKGIELIEKYKKGQV